MHDYLYNGNELWPKAVNLCTRGRNALLDLERGPGTSFDLALFGPAWEVHLHSVAATNPFQSLRTHLTGTRYLAAWPLVTQGLFEYLQRAHELQQLATEAENQSSPKNRARLHTLAKEVSFYRYLGFSKRACESSPKSGRTCAPPRFNGEVPSRRRGPKRWSPTLLRLARDWGRRLKGALIHRLGFSARALNVPLPKDNVLSARGEVGGGAGESAASSIQNFSKRLEAAARAAGLFYRDRDYNRFRRRHLTAELQDYPIRLSLFQLKAIEDQLRERRKRPEAKLQRVRGARRRLVYIVDGKMPTPPPPQKVWARLKRVRKSYLELKKKLEADRARLKKLATEWFAQKGRAALDARLKRVGETVLGGCYYFETEHLDETRSGFTHVSLLHKMPAMEGRPSEPWQFDRVLGFQYAYPVSKLETSVPVEIVEPAPKIFGRKRTYAWVEIQVPKVFRFPNGARSSRVTLTNIVYDMKRRLRQCPHLRVTPGFYYAAATWLLRKAFNRALFKDSWRAHSHRSYTYFNLDKEKLQRLKGSRLHVPVEWLPNP